MLLRAAARPTFITLNWSDFWQRVHPEDSFCVICLALPTNRIEEVSPALRRLFRLTDFRSKLARMGTVARVSGERVVFYRAKDLQPYVLPLPPNR